MGGLQGMGWRLACGLRAGAYFVHRYVRRRHGRLIVGRKNRYQGISVRLLHL